jgi:hypothetical protein
MAMTRGMTFELGKPKDAVVFARSPNTFLVAEDHRQ